MADLRERFKAIDREPAPDLTSVIAARARHFAVVPGALGSEDLGRRRRMVISPIQVLAAVAIVSIVIGLAVVLQLRAQGPVKHKASPPPSTALSAVCPTADCVLEPGTYSVDWPSVSTLTFAISNQWHVDYAIGDWKDLQLGHDSQTVIWVGVQPAAGSYAECPASGVSTATADYNPARAPKAIADWLVGHPKLITSNVHAVEVGGLEGVVLDAVDVQGFECPLLAIPAASYPWDLWRILSGEKGRLYLLEIPRAGQGSSLTVAIGIKATRAEFDKVTHEVEPILKSFVFS